MRRLALLTTAVLTVSALIGLAWRTSPIPAPVPVPVPVPSAARAELGLFTSLPILWAEAGGVAALVDDRTPPHWARAVLEREHRLVPLDVLDRMPPGLQRLVMAQPRPLAPAENVALDRWLRQGGHLLLLADPMLTEDSAFAPGDRRRPQDVALLSPLLTHWGLGLLFDAEQPAGERQVPSPASGEPLPVDLPGRLQLRAGGEDSACRIVAAGVAATCRIGRGRALIVADAAVMERGGDITVRRAALAALLDAAFPG